ncbi:MAG: alcohol dehydrogenase catalytic domain-containing protein [Actinobacteria bacterium]|nr:alcohol dehydrogenase catalytic domain-containing protein [Actinomycetota bacterium]
MENLMKSLVLKDIRDFELMKVPIPNVGPNDVLIKVKAAAICHTDFTVMDKQHPWTKYPCVLGHEFAGVVERSGKEVFHVKPGDRVTALAYSYCGVCTNCRRGIHTGCNNMIAIPFHYDGAYQEFILVPGITVYPIADSLSFENAAMTEPAANACSIVDKAKIYPGEKLVIIGPGPIGLFAVQFAALKNPDVIIVIGTRDERLDISKEFGATHTINVKKEDPYEKIMEITNGYGADVIFYCGGGHEVWELAEKVLAPFGRFIIEAIPLKADDRYLVNPFKFIEKSMIYTGVSGYSAAHFESALHLIETGTIKTKQIITHRFSLDNYKEAFETVESRKGGAIKVLFNSF